MRTQLIILAGAFGAWVPAVQAQTGVVTASGPTTASIYAAQRVDLLPGFVCTTAGFEAGVKLADLTGGRWSAPRLWTSYARTTNGPVTGMIGIHTHLLPSGKVLSWEGHNDNLNQGHLAHAYEWNPNPTAQIGSLRYPNLYAHFDLSSSNIFCSGHTFLGNGKLLVVGGHYSNGLVNRDIPPGGNVPTDNPVNDQYHPDYIPLGTGMGYIGIRDANLFDFTIANNWPGAAQPWQAGVPAMQYRRWYPTATTLGDGRVLVVAGQRYGDPTWASTGGQIATQADIPEVYNPANAATPWQQLTSASRVLPYYPWMFLAPDGRVFNAGPNHDMQYLNPTAATIDGTPPNAWTTNAAPSNINREYGSAVMYTPGRILILGGQTYSGLGITNTTALVDITQPGVPGFRTGPPMAYARTHVNATLLADGTVLVTGGMQSASDTQPAEAGAVYATELWTPPTNAAPDGMWTTLNSMSVPRLYHSTAVLLPDATVLSVGGGQGGNFPDHPDYQIFTPPYLCRGYERPQISAAPLAVAYGQSFTLTRPSTGQSAGRVTLVRLSSVTHSFNMNQRFLELTPISYTDTQINLTAPSDRNLCPPGHYMLFLIDANGTPSQASIIAINTTACTSNLSIAQALVSDSGCDKMVRLTASGGGTGTYTWMVNGILNASTSATVDLSINAYQPTVEVQVEQSGTCGGRSTFTTYFPRCVYISRTLPGKP